MEVVSVNGSRQEVLVVVFLVSLLEIVTLRALVADSGPAAVLRLGQSSTMVKGMAHADLKVRHGIMEHCCILLSCVVIPCCRAGLLTVIAAGLVHPLQQCVSRAGNQRAVCQAFGNT